jgi:dTDP-4-dehydrorhamnose 3,5-epimerase
MNVVETRLPGVLVLEPRIFRDERGHFAETWRLNGYGEAGITAEFVQDNVSVSHRGVLRGLHFQNPEPQGKLVTVLHGSVFDVAVDVRRGSPTFGEWEGVDLSGENLRQLWIPEGFAHGFVVTSDVAVFSYKCTGYYAPGCERSLRWDDPDIGIAWPVTDPLVSDKDAAAPLLKHLPAEVLFTKGRTDRGIRNTAAAVES